MNRTKRFQPFFAMLGAFLCLFISGRLAAAEKWNMQYFYDENDSSLTLTDFKFPSARRGIAAGFISKKSHIVLLGERETDLPIVLVTSDSGKTWSQVAVKEIPNSLFFLDDSTGWMVANGGIWFTTESGRTWTRISGQQKLSRVHFLSASHGFGAGRDQTPVETNDGGKTWKPISITGAPARTKGSTIRVLYREIAFDASGNGIISGEIFNPYEDEQSEPTWMRAEHTWREMRNQLNVFFVTHDDGKSWIRTIRSMYGRVSRIVPSLKGHDFALSEFPQFYPWASNLDLLDLMTDSTTRLASDRDRIYTDVLQISEWNAYVAGYQTPGHVHPSPIPGKVRIMRSRNLMDWTDIPVDYRAVARHVWLASAGGSALWAATDTGMILKLEQQPGK